MKPTRERRIAAIAAMRDLPIDVKVRILGMANLYRNTPSHPRIKWPLRYAEQRTSTVTAIAAVPPHLVGVLLPPQVHVAAADHLFDELMPPFAAHFAANDDLLSLLDMFGPGPGMAPEA